MRTLGPDCTNPTWSVILVTGRVYGPCRARSHAVPLGQVGGKAPSAIHFRERFEMDPSRSLILPNTYRSSGSIPSFISSPR